MVIIISEIGINHSGNIDTAKEMVRLSKEAGADIAKFQIFDKEDYTDDRIRACWLSQDSFKEIKKYCDKCGIEFLCTPEKPAHVDFLETLGVKRYKVGNNHLSDLLLLERIEKTKKPVFLSANEKDALYAPFAEACDLDKALNIFSDFTLHSKVKVLYCVPKYPPKPEELKLRILKSLDQKFDGISNHYPSILPSLIAIAYGAEVIETHVMLSEGSPIDAPVSITFSELGQLVSYARQMEAMIWGKQ